MNTVNFVKSYLFVECTSFDVSAESAKIYTTPTMTSSSSVQCLYEYSNLTSFEVISKESFLSTVNNGKALCMTVHVRSFLKRRCFFALLSVAVLRTTHEKKSNTMIVVYSSIIHTVNNGKAWSMPILYAKIL